MLSFYEYFWGYFSGYGIVFALILRINDGLLFSTLLFGMALPVFMVASRDKSPVVLTFFNRPGLGGLTLLGNSGIKQETGNVNKKKLNLGKVGESTFIDNVEFLHFCEKIETKETNYVLCSILWLPAKLANKTEILLKWLAIRASHKK
jgi:hypothetical protein